MKLVKSFCISLYSLTVITYRHIYCHRYCFPVPDDLLYLQVIPRQWPLILLGLIGGLVGSIIDSILGATLQYSGFNLKSQKVVNFPGDPDQVFHISGVNLLTNNQVNFVSATLTAAVVGCFALQLF